MSELQMVNINGHGRHKLRSLPYLSKIHVIN